MTRRHTKGGSLAIPLITYALTTRPRTIKEMLDIYGDKQIVAVQIGRIPITAVVNHIYHVIGGEKLKKIKDQYNYSDVFHLWIVLKLSDGTLIKIEKAHRVVVTVNPKIDTPDNTPFITVPNQLTLKQLIDQYEAKRHDMAWFYDETNANCQILAKDLVNLLGITQYDSWIKQNIDSVLNVWYHMIAVAVTSGQALADYVVHGGGRVQLL